MNPAPTFLLTWSRWPPSGNADELTDHIEFGQDLKKMRRRLQALKRDDMNTNVTLSVIIES